jgi:dinuclear metal center YbgI/SA1388 family protein
MERVATVIPTSAPLEALIGTCERLLNPSAYSDYGPNGLQVPGRTSIRCVATGVSASQELFERAAAEGADAVLVHHGLFWKGPPRPLDLPAKRRLSLLFEHDLSLLAYHLPLDGHQEHGNAALIAAGLRAPRWSPFGGEPPLGVLAELPPGTSSEGLVRHVSDLTQRPPLAFLDGPEEVRTLAVVTGAGASFLDDAIAAGADAFLTGEPSERVMTRAREAGIHFLAAGHYATETFGVRRIGDLLAAEHGIRHVFVDVPNPI